MGMQTLLWKEKTYISNIQRCCWLLQVWVHLGKVCCVLMSPHFKLFSGIMDILHSVRPFLKSGFVKYCVNICLECKHYHSTDADAAVRRVQVGEVGAEASVQLPDVLLLPPGARDTMHNNRCRRRARNKTWFVFLIVCYAVNKWLKLMLSFWDEIEMSDDIFKIMAEMKKDHDSSAPYPFDVKLKIKSII